MERAARRIEGKHDFAAFAGPYEGKGSTVRTLRRCEVGGCGERLQVEMALAEVGLGRMTEDAFVALLDAAPSSAGPAAPACGLYLAHIQYAEPIFGLEVGDGRDA
jgi:tRNA U38,U39,U40 pseudouridine synthase TruA